MAITSIRGYDVFYTLSFMAVTFFVTGAMCLGGALMRVPQYDDKEIWSELAYTHRVSSYDADEREKLRLKMNRTVADVGELRGYLEHKIQGVDERYQKVADDFYRHLSLNAKKAKTKGHQ